MTHPVLTSGRTALVTGAANGIGLASARRFAEFGMQVSMADMAAEDLDRARAEVAAVAKGGPDAVIAVARAGGTFDGAAADWRRMMDVNFWGVVDCVRAVLPGMIEAGNPGLIILAGSKQGITNPPGNTAYNITKSALKTYTEALEHDLRNTDGCKVTAHLLIPGWTRVAAEEQARGAWAPDQVVDFMLEALDGGAFYIMCPDGETTLEMDRKRILWSAGDVTENRPALSRWHADFGQRFEDFEP